MNVGSLTDRKVSALVPLLSSDALASASVDGCPSASSAELELLELVDEHELLVELVELSWLLGGGSSVGPDRTDSG